MTTQGAIRANADISLRQTKKLAQWVREGECNNCGWCCQNLAVERHVIHPQDAKKGFAPTELRFWQLRGGIPEEDARGKVRVVLLQASMAAPCAEHDNENKACQIYEQRPAVCRTFPEKPEQIEGSPCTYWFKFQLGDATIRRGGRGSPWPTEPTYPEHRDERTTLEDGNG